MPRDLRAATARRRQRVTGEPFTAAMRNIQDMAGGASELLPIPNPDQQKLEAEFIRSIGDLDLKQRSDRISIAVEPHSNHLLINLQSAVDLADLAAGILPALDSPDGEFSGIPRLRFCESPRGILLYTLGSEAGITLARTTKRQWATALTDAFTGLSSHVRLLWRDYPESLSDAELLAHSLWRDPFDVESMAVRRIGVFAALAPSHFKAWTPSLDEFHIQVRVDAYDPQREDRFISLLTDSRFQPKVIFVERSNHWLEFELPSSRRLLVRIELAHTPSVAGAMLGLGATASD